jgi:WD40 repeat protein
VYCRGSPAASQGWGRSWFEIFGPGRQLLVEGHYQEAAPYLLAARQNGEEGPPLKMMFWAVRRHSPLVPALEHQDWVVSAAFSPDGTRVVTASGDQTARVWDVRLDEGTLEQWSAVVERSSFVLFGGSHLRRVLSHRESSKPP